MPSLIDEIVRHVRETLAGPFGDDLTDAGCKVWGDLVPPESLPWGVLYEVGESYTFMTRAGEPGTPYLADGQINMDVFAADREQARTLGVQVAHALDDCESLLSPEEGPVMMLRVVRAAFVPVATVAPGSGAIFQRSLTISYQQQRII